MKLRPMSPMQLAFHHLSELVNPNSGELITLDGHLDVQRLHKAIGLALSRHPLLNSVPVKKWGRHYWREEAEPLPIDLRVSSIPDEQEDAVMDVLLGHLWQERIPQTGRQVRFFYTEGKSKSYLQICAPHSVTDAWSGTRLAADIAQAYGALTEGRAYQPTVVRPLDESIDEAFLNRPSLRQRAALLGETLRRIVGEVFSDGAGLSLDAAKRPGDTKLSITEVSAELLQRTIRVARAQGATAHTLFLMALTKARTDLVDKKQGNRLLRINDFATLRPYADRDLRDAFDVLVVPNQVNIDPNWDDAEALKAISSHLRDQKAGAVLPELYRLALYGFLARFVPTRMTADFVFKCINKTDLAVTNPGRVPWQDELASFGDVPVADFLNFPHLLPPAKVVLIFTTFRGALRIVQLYDPATTPNGVEATLVEPFIRHLEALLAQYEGVDAPSLTDEAQGHIGGAPNVVSFARESTFASPRNVSSRKRPRGNRPNRIKREPQA